MLALGGFGLSGDAGAGAATYGRQDVVDVDEHQEAENTGIREGGALRVGDGEGDGEEEGEVGVAGFRQAPEKVGQEAQLQEQVRQAAEIELDDPAHVGAAVGPPVDVTAAAEDPIVERLREDEHVLEHIGSRDARGDVPVRENG